MPEIRVSAQQLSAKADELQQLNESLKSQIGILESTEASIAGMWEGSAKETFHSEFQKDKGQMETLKTTFDQYITVLREIAANYAQKEAMNQEIASERKY